MSRVSLATATVGLLAWLASAQIPALYTTRVPVVLMVFGFVVPLWTGLGHDAVRRFANVQPYSNGPLAALYGIAVLVLVAGLWLTTLWLQLLGAVAIAGLGTLQAVRYLRLPIAKDLATREVLAKGDDACMKQLRFAHIFLALGVWLLVASVALPDGIMQPRMRFAALHTVLVGFGMLSTYAVSHLWVPRLSGVPAIAAGAIKGQLHTTMLGVVGLIAGFLSGSSGILVGVGFFAFVGFFTWMGVLGANMMRNKSKTQRVTPEFVYIPATFTAVFWLVVTVLMGLFLRAAPGTLAADIPHLRVVHYAAGVLGGMLQLALGLWTRIAPMDNGEAPPRFQGGLRYGYFAFNVSLLALLGSLWNPSWALPATAALLGSAVWFAWPLAKFYRPKAVAAA